MTIDMMGREEANAWLFAAQQLNDRTEALLDEVSKTLTDIKNESEGSIVDEIFSLGNKVSTQTRSLMSAMNAIATTVNKVLGVIGGALSKGVELVSAASGKI